MMFKGFCNFPKSFSPLHPFLFKKQEMMRFYTLGVDFKEFTQTALPFPRILIT